MTGHHLSAALVAVAMAGCGDNSQQCGAGTIDSDGVCLPTITAMCGDGTVLASGQCLVDPAACLAGTVLIANRCVDPTSGLVIDLEESREPNGLAVAAGVEASASPAGTIALKPGGEPFVVHGHLTPFRDDDHDGQLDPDVDTYLIVVAAPTLLEITVAGLGGAQGAFYAVGEPLGALPAYQRYGLSLAGSTVRRRLLLPAAGRYRLAICDTRALAIGRDPPPAAGSGGAAGGAGAEYYASIAVEPIGAPAQIAGVAGAGTQTGTLAADEVKLFTMALAAGVTDIHSAMPGGAAASVAVIDAGALVGYADEVPAAPSRPPSEAAVMVAVAAGASPVIVVDAVYNYGPAPEPFVLTIAPH